MNAKTILLVILLAVTAMRSAAQATMAADLDRYRMQRMQEKLFVHTDKEAYLAGEICWFRLYMVEAGSHRPLDKSKVAYLEWLDGNNKPVLQAKVGMDKGRGDGSVYLPLTVPTGNYTLRAYTSLMKNWGADWFFEKTITVINTRKSRPGVVAAGGNSGGPGSPVPAGSNSAAAAGSGFPAAQSSSAAAAPTYTVNFFPEGGHLVESLASTVAFRVTDPAGMGVACTGVITEDEQDTVATANPYRFGIGHFVLTPKPGHHYRSLFRLPDGMAINTLLPAAEKEGMVMRVEQGDKDFYAVDVQSAGPGSDGAAIYLVAHTRQSVRYAEAKVLQGGKASFRVRRDSLGDGISHFTVFNAARQPVCERLVFQQPSRRLHIDVHADKSNYETREKISLTLSTADETSRPVAADCSLSVFLADSLQQVTKEHILPYLLLASDLKGRIESPDYYFEHPDDREAMDNLLMTHGWRRFNWDDVLRHVPPRFDYPLEFNGSIVTGKLVDSRTGAAAPGMVQTYLSVPGTRTQFTVARTDDEGELRFELTDFYGNQEIIVQTNPVDSGYRVEINSPFSDRYSDRRPLPFEGFRGPGTGRGDHDSVGRPGEPNFFSQLEDRNIAEQVLNRYAGLRLKQLSLPITDTGSFFRPDYSYLLDDFVRFTTMEEVMREYVVMMFVKRRGGHFHLPLFNVPYSEPFDNDPLILLDGVPIFDIDKLMALDPLKLRKLQTLQRRFFMGGATFSGIMNWTSYKGDLAGYILDPHAVVIDYPGVELLREFYSPGYATAEDRASHLPDFRNVLFWSPELATDAGGKKPVSFYSSDIPGRYIVVVEGLSADGRPGTGIGSFEVK